MDKYRDLVEYVNQNSVESDPVHMFKIAALWIGWTKGDIVVEDIRRALTEVGVDIGKFLSPNQVRAAFAGLCGRRRILERQKPLHYYRLTLRGGEKAKIVFDF